MTMALRRFIGKCPTKGCRFHTAVDGTPRYVSNQSTGWTEWVIPGTTLRVDWINDRIAHLNPTQRNEYRQRHTDRGLWCTEHDQPARMRPLKATVDAAKPCGPACHSARSATCSCACGGANHGAAHTADPA